MRLLLLFFIGLTFGFGGGFLVGGGLGPSSHDHAGHDDDNHDTSSLLQWTGPPANLSLGFTSDAANALNLNIQADGFIFTPETVNTDPTPGTGHAHVYLNGEKIGRAYGPWFHIETVLPGDVIRVTLNADNHAPWGDNGTPIAAEITYQ
jgi:hypothetical protein